MDIIFSRHRSLVCLPALWQGGERQLSISWRRCRWSRAGSARAGSTRRTFLLVRSERRWGCPISRRCCVALERAAFRADSRVPNDAPMYGEDSLQRIGYGAAAYCSSMTSARRGRRCANVRVCCAGRGRRRSPQSRSHGRDHRTVQRLCIQTHCSGTRRICASIAAVISAVSATGSSLRSVS